MTDRPTEEVLLVGRDHDGEVHVVCCSVLALTLHPLGDGSPSKLAPGTYLRTRDRVDGEGRPLFVHSEMINVGDIHPVLRRLR